MALLAALSHPVQIVRSTTAYLLAPAPLDDGVATRIVWSQTDFLAGRFVRSRILRVRAAL